MTLKQKNIYTVAPHEDFLRTLATYIWNLKKADILSLSQVRIILPNRRSVHKIKEYFVEISSSKALILPQITSLGGIDEDGIEIELALKERAYQQIRPAISNERRLFLLSQLIREKSGQGFGLSDISFEAALKLATSLADLLDDVEKHQLTIDDLEKIIPDELPEHSRISLNFIRFIFDEYPKMLSELGYTDNAGRTNQLLALYSQHLSETPPAAEIFIAGSTGSIPATRKLIKTILSLEKGYVILPYTDLSMNSFEWDAIGTKENPISHQKHIHRLLKELEVKREEIKPLGPEKGKREELVSNIMRNSNSIEKWKDNKTSAEELNWFSIIEAKNTIHEAKLAGTILRHKAGQGLKTALITNNIELASAVELYLKKFSIDAENSAGSTLADIPEGAFMLSVAGLISNNFRVSYLLDLLKSPYFSGIGIAAIEKLEIDIIRENNIKYLSELFEKFTSSVITGLDPVIQPQRNHISELLDSPVKPGNDKTSLLAMTLERIYQISKKISADMSLSELIARTYEIINLSRDLDVNKNDSWQAIEQSINDFSFQAQQQIETSLYADSLRIILSGKRRWENHKPHRLVAILSPQEARLQHFDVAVLADLTLGSWPAGKFSPWLNRRMYHEMELPFEEDAISLSAHDLASHLHHKEVFLTLSRYDSDEVSIESPFITRLKSFYKAVTGNDIDNNSAYLSHLESENNVESKTYPLSYPKPPVSARFSKLRVTELETLLKDPYSIYAKKILRLEKLNDIEAEVEPRHYGTYVHKVVEEFTKYHNGDAAKITHEKFMEIAGSIHAKLTKTNKASPIWLSQLNDIAKWFVDTEKQNIRGISKLISESNAELKISDFILTCKADRIEITINKKINIADYKTGKLPEEGSVNKLTSPQLLLEAYMLQNNAFKEIQPQGYELGEIIYYNLSFGYKGPKRETYDKVNLSEKLPEIEQGLQVLIKDIKDPLVPFLIRPNPALRPDFSDYEHLERVEK